MDHDLISLLIYLALGLIGVIASARKNIIKKQQAAQQRHVPEVPRTFTAGEEKDMEPGFGPLIELFDIPAPKHRQEEYKTIEEGPMVEDYEKSVDTEEASAELAGMSVDTPVSELEKTEEPVAGFNEEGQSDIQKMIAKYNAIRKELDQDGLGEDIASGEIVSAEAEEEERIKRQENRQFFDARKAIIYSEILKRRDY